MHQKQQVGWSLYDSITALENYNDKVFQKNFISETVLQQLNYILWQQWTDWLPQFQSITTLIIHPSENSLSALNLPQYSLSVSEDISTQTQKLLNLLADVQIKSQLLAKSIHFPYSIQSKKEWEQFLQVITELQSLPDIPLELVHYLSNKENYSAYEEWSKEFRKYIQAVTNLQNLPGIPFEFIRYLSDKDNYNVYEEWSKAFSQYQTAIFNILNDYNERVLKIGIAATEIQWNRAQQSWALPKWLQTRKIKKQLVRLSEYAI